MRETKRDKRTGRQTKTDRQTERVRDREGERERERETHTHTKKDMEGKREIGNVGRGGNTKMASQLKDTSTHPDR